MDFVKFFEKNLGLNIFKHLDDPADLVRASILSRDWRDFVVGSELSKQLCLRQFPQVADIVNVHETTRKRKLTDVNGSEGELILSRNHFVYASLLHALQKLTSSPSTDCVKRKFSFSDYPSKGLKDDSIPETLIFKLKYDQCVITEVDMIPVRVYLKGIQLQEEEYCAKLVRFRTGFSKSATKESANNIMDPDFEDSFIWTYASPEFPMNRVCQQLAQGGRGQQFKFPEPVLCIGGFVMIELLGRVQMDEREGPYYISINDVNVLGRSLSPAFKAEVQDQSGKFVLNYNAGRLSQTIHSSFNGGRPPKVQKLYHRTKVPINRTKRIPARRSTCACACSNDIEL